jgi:hypothetical protein
MGKPESAVASTVSIAVEAFTNNPKDNGFHHCFEQKDDATLTFRVSTDVSVKTIHFVLWKLHDPVNPGIATSVDSSVRNGRATITISHPNDEHLGPGPYCATLTASSSAAAPGASASAETIVGETVYYYETWTGSRNCKK